MPNDDDDIFRGVRNLRTANRSLLEAEPNSSVRRLEHETNASNEERELKKELEQVESDGRVLRQKYLRETNVELTQQGLPPIRNKLHSPEVARDRVSAEQLTAQRAIVARWTDITEPLDKDNKGLGRQQFYIENIVTGGYRQVNMPFAVTKAGALVGSEVQTSRITAIGTFVSL